MIKVSSNNSKIRGGLILSIIGRLISFSLGIWIVEIIPELSLLGEFMVILRGILLTGGIVTFVGAAVVFFKIKIGKIIIWIGGAIFYDRVLAPSMSAISPDQVGKLMGAIGKRFTPLVWGLISIIGITGLIRSYLKGTMNISFLLDTSSGNILLLKAILVCTMLAFGLLITKAGLQLPKSPSPEYALKIQKRIKLLSERNIVVGIIVILFAVARL